MITVAVLMVVTVVSMIAAHHAMVLAHEWSHSVIAWALGYKKSPFAIRYGDWTLLNVDEDIDYAPILASAKPWRASLIAGAALLTNALLYLSSLAVLQGQFANPNKRTLTILFAFWFAVFNMSQLYSYMPLRAFSPSGDVGYFEAGLRIPAWLGFVVGTPLVVRGLVILFSWALPLTCEATGLSSAASLLTYSPLTVAVVFGMYGAAPLFYYGMRDRRSLWSLFSLGVGAIVLAVLVGKALSRPVVG